jgi:hypothetical protein
MTKPLIDIGDGQFVDPEAVVAIAFDRSDPMRKRSAIVIGQDAQEACMGSDVPREQIAEAVNRGRG